MLRPALVGAIAVALLAGGPDIAAAQTPADRCLGAPDEAALRTCRQAELAQADQQLQQALDKLRNRYQDDEPASWKLLDEAQKAWSSYSLAECRFRTRESTGGAGFPAYLASCLTELSRRRLQDLQAVLARP